MRPAAGAASAPRQLYRQQADDDSGERVETRSGTSRTARRSSSILTPCLAISADRHQTGTSSEGDRVRRSTCEDLENVLDEWILRVKFESRRRREDTMSRIRAKPIAITGRRVNRGASGLGERQCGVDVRRRRSGRDTIRLLQCRPPGPSTDSGSTASEAPATGSPSSNVASVSVMTYARWASIARETSGSATNLISIVSSI